MVVKIALPASLVFNRFEQVLALDRVAFADWRALPDTPGLYFAITNGERVAYIGAARKSLRRRWNQHSHVARIMYLGSVEIAYVELDDLPLLREAEVRAIMAFRPPVNRHHIYGHDGKRQKVWPFLLLE